MAIAVIMRENYRYTELRIKKIGNEQVMRAARRIKTRRLGQGASSQVDWPVGCLLPGGAGRADAWADTRSAVPSCAVSEGSAVQCSESERTKKKKGKEKRLVPRKLSPVCRSRSCMRDPKGTSNVGKMGAEA
mgnify:CR=1 FL=1